MNRFERDLSEQFADIAEVAKPYTKQELQRLNDFQKGELDRLRGVEHKQGMSEAYTEGYRRQYEREAKR